MAKTKELKDEVILKKEREEKALLISSYKPTDEEEEIRINAYQRFTDMKASDDRNESETDWDNADKDYRGYTATLDEDDYRTNINKPIAFSIIETELQETIDRMSRPLVKPREHSDIAGSKFVNDVMRFSFDVGGFDYQYYLAKKEAYMYGTGFLLDYYRVDKRTVKKLDYKQNEEGEYEETYTLEEKVDFDDCYAEYVPIRDIYLDPAANHVSKCRDMIYREILNIDETRRKYEKKKGFYNIEYIVAGGDTSSYSHYEPPKDINFAQEIEVLHYYNRATDEYNVVANDVVIRKGGLPYPHKELPVVAFYGYKIPNKLYGLGIPKIIRALVEERNTLANLRLDAQKIALQKMFLYDDIVDIDDIDLVARPHGGIPVNTNGRPLRDVIQYIEYSDVKPSNYKDDELLMDDIRRTVGVDDRVQGLNVGGTATEAAILKESSMKRINAKMKLNEIDGMVRLGRLRLENIKFYYPIPKLERITKPNSEVTYKKQYKTIRVEGREYSFDEQGNLNHEDKEGIYFFKLDKKASKYLEADYDITYDPTYVQPLSKPLQQGKTNEMFDRLTANPKTLNEVDGRKASHRLLNVNDEEPDLWLKKTSNIVDMQLHAEMENKVMKVAYPIPPTPGATPEHTQVHLYFTKSSEFEQLPPEIQDIFETHIAGEAGGQGVPMDGTPNMTSQLPSPGMSPQDVNPTAATPRTPTQI